MKKKKSRHKKKAAAQAEIEDAKGQAEKETAAAAGANCENAETKSGEVERVCTGSMMNGSVEMANEAGGRHRGLHNVNEEAGHIVFHTEHVEHDMNDGPDGNEKKEAESKGIESTSTEAAPYVAVEKGMKRQIIRRQ